MEASFKIDDCNTLVVGNDVSVPDCWQGQSFIGIVHRYEQLSVGPRLLQRVGYACGAAATADANAADLPSKCPIHDDCPESYRYRDEEAATIKQTQVARLKPHEARALASVLLSAATQAQSK